MSETTTKTTFTLFKETVSRHQTSIIIGASAFVTIVLAVKESKRAVNNEHKSLRGAMSGGKFVIPLEKNRYVVIPVLCDNSKQE